MEECTVLIIANEEISKNQTIGIYKRDFSHSKKIHADIYREFCHKYFPELEKLLSDGMMGTDCADLFASLGQLSYIRFLDFVELYIPEPEELSPTQKTWLNKNYHILNEQYAVDICIFVNNGGYTITKKYESSVVKTGVIEELRDIVSEKESKKVKS